MRELMPLEQLTYAQIAPNASAVTSEAARAIIKRHRLRARAPTGKTLVST